MLSDPTPIDNPTTKTILKLNFKNKYPVNNDPKIKPIIIYINLNIQQNRKNQLMHRLHLIHF